MTSITDFDKVLFSTIHPIDKVVYQSPTAEVIVNDGNTTGGAYQKSKIVTSNIDNPYDKKVFARAVWSLDNVNWYSTNSRLTYTFTLNYSEPGFSVTQTLSGLQGAVSVGVSDSTIRIKTANGFHGTVTQTPSTTTYTPTSQTFYVKYILFEVA